MPVDTAFEASASMVSVTYIGHIVAKFPLKIMQQDSEIHESDYDVT